VDCSNLICAKSPICLNTAILSDLNSLTLKLMFLLVYKPDHIQNLTFHVLVNSESTHYFVNTTFIWKYNIPTSPTILVKLKLFNRLSNNIISEIVSLPIIFTSSHWMILNIYVTSLNFSYLLVLRYNWLTQHNPSIDWTMSSITFWLSSRKENYPGKILIPEPS